MALSLSMSATETLQRLSSKPGVSSTLTIDRASSTLLSMKGSVSTLLPAADVPAAGAQRTQTALGTVEPASVTLPGDSALSAVTEEEKLNEFVKMIWKYVNDTEHMIQAMDNEDDLKLLRLRTKKHELLIVPDSKFISVVVHDVKSS